MALDGFVAMRSLVVVAYVFVVLPRTIRLIHTPGFDDMYQHVHPWRAMHV